MAMSIEQISAYIEIKQALARYCRGVDRCDVDMLKSIYHPDGTDDHTVFKGSGHDFAPWIVERLKDEPAGAQHQITTSLVTFHGPLHADVESYYFVYQPEKNATTGEETLLHTGGRYLDKFECRDGEWKVASRVVTVDWSRAHLPGDRWPGQDAFPAIGKQDDLSYSLLSLA